MLDIAYLSAFSALSLGQKLSILIYHQVLPEYDPMRPDEITAERFDQQMGWIASNFRVFTVSDALEKLRTGTLPNRSLCITFDDGYENNTSIALPILQKHNLCATLFVASDFLDGGIMWNDRVIESLRLYPENTIDLRWLGLECFSLDSLSTRAQAAKHVLNQIKHLDYHKRQQAVERIGAEIEVPSDIMLTSTQLRGLADAGIEIGGHTCSHPILSVLTPEAQQQEIKTNKQVLESIINRPVTGFAYPNGKPTKDYTATSLQAVKDAGYQWAVTTHSGVTGANSVPFQLPRYTPWRQRKVGFMLQLAANYRTSFQPL